MTEPLLGGTALRAADHVEPFLRAGNSNCGGCGMSITWQMLAHATNDRHLQVVIPACCGIVSAGPFPLSAYGVPVLASTFAASAAVATGLAHAARLNGEPTRVVCVAGDGGTYDIGMATLSAAAERNEDILYICYDNEIYGNTGGQRSSATPLGAATSTTPGGKDVEKKDIVAIMAAHRVPYVATISLAHAEDTVRKLRSALALQGFRFVHVLAPCPTGWKSDPSQSVELVRLAVRSGLYPVLEIIDGRDVRINVEPDAPERAASALQQYFSMQGRFRGHTVDLVAMRHAIERQWAGLRPKRTEESR